MSAATPSRVRARILAGETQIGSFVNLGDALVAEIMGIAGFDWVVLDLEHGAGDERTLLAQLHALSHTGTAVVVRVEGVDGARILRALDLGADGVLVPRLRSVDDAREAVELCRYAGRRGVARYNRCWHWGLARRPMEDVDGEVLCAVQIETGEALAVVEEIAAIDGVDVLFVGPSDLGHALGINGGSDDPRLLESAARVAKAARDEGKAAGMLVPAVAQARRYRELGFTFLGCSSDGSLLAAGARALAGELAGLREPMEGRGEVGT